MSEVAQAAVAWAGAGFCVLPLRSDGSKAPDVPWRCYNQEKASAVVPAPPSMQMVERWFVQDRHGLGLIMGAVSGNAEMFEFEGRALDEGLLRAFVDLARSNGAGDLWEKLNSGYVERTPSGGLHFIYRVDGRTVRNVELARRPSTDAELAKNPKNPIQMLIEVIGEGGHTIVAPSARDSHPTGKPWVTLKGEPGEVVTLSVEERDQLHEIARMLDSVPEYVRTVAPKRERAEGALPGDDFAARTDWSEILEPQGWTYVSQKGDYTYWLRPGKEATGADRGCSASTGGGHDGQDFLRVWSTSTTLEANVDHTKFYVWAHYNTGSDLSEAARELRSQGYGGEGDWAPAAIVPGCTNPFDDGFDPMAWAKKRAAENVSPVGPVPMVAPQPEAGHGGESSVEGEFHALDWGTLFSENYVQEWIVEGMLPRAATVALYSASGLGKSLFSLEMAARISMGEPFLGLRTRRTRVLYIDHENGPRTTIVPRLKAMGFAAEQLADLMVLSFPNMATLDSEAGGAAIIRAVAQFDAGLVIIDTVSRTIQGEENSNDTWLAFFRHTGRVLKEAEIAYIRLDHTGKDESKGQRGGSAKTGDVEIILALGRGDGGTFALVPEKDRDNVLPMGGYVFKRLSGPLRSERTREAARASDGTFAETSETRLRIGRKIEELLKVPDTKLLRSQVEENVRGKDTLVLAVLDSLADRDFIRTQPHGRGTVYFWNHGRKGSWETPDSASQDVL